MSGVCTLLLEMEACVLAVSGSATAPARPDRPNILLISLDSVRPDHLGCYGYDRPTSRHIDAFAKDAVLFRRAYSTSNCTVPAHASLLTGRLPRAHGALLNYSGIARGVPTLAEALRQIGYVTQALVSSAILSKWCGLGRGFDVYDDYTVLMLAEQAAAAEGARFDELLAVPCGLTTGQALRMLRQLAAATKPFFLLVHYYDPHFVYVAVPPYRSDFVRPCARSVDPRRIWSYSRDATSLTKSDLRYLQDLYDAEIANTDNHVGALLAEVNRLGLEGKTWVWIVSDHGQEFAEHGGLLHGRTLFEEVTRVAMIVRPPKKTTRGRTINALATLADFAPTILDAVGARRSPATDGVSLLPCLKGDPTETPRPHVIAEATVGTAVVGDRYKLIASTDNISRWFDLAGDPTELKPLQAAPAPLMEAFSPIVRSRQTVEGSGQETHNPPEAMPRELKERLRGLGYAVP